MVLSQIWTRNWQRPSAWISITPMLLGRRITTMPALPERSLFTDRQNILFTVQVRQWVNLWHSHLGDEATPKALVDVISRKKVGGATKMRDEIKKEFQLV